MPISTTQLNGQNGFKVEVGGGSIAVRGDFNHDGIDDLVIGSPGASPAGRTGAGQTYVLFGASGFSATIAESAITGAAGFVIRGVAAGDGSGFAVDYVDINGDGIDDLVIGAPFVDLPGAADAGSAYVVYGTATPPGAPFELSSLNGTNGFVLTGDTTNNGSRAGYSVSAGGDFNQDGRADLLIGSPFPGSMFGPEHSHAYVVYGAAGFAASVALSTMTGAAGITYTGTFQDQLGRDVADVGDVNGDGRPDILITRFFEASVGIPDQPTTGRLIFGPPGAVVDPDQNWQISEEGPTNDVSGVGDFNGDGIDDFIVALHNDEAFAYGRTASDGVRINAAAAIVYGRTGGWEGTTKQLNSNKGFVMLSPDLSWTVSSAGDFNGDGRADIIVSAGTAAYVVFGSSVPRFDIDLRNMAASEGLAITDVGTAAKVAGAGDVNDDGFDDVAITSSLGTFVIFGSSAGGGSSGTGTDGDDTLTGTAGIDVLDGRGGNDILFGLGGDDNLIGGTGDDYLVGGTGNDRMEGGAGNDTYYVDSLGDVVVEAVGGGNDRVATSVSYALAAGAEIEVFEAVNLTATDQLSLTGNDFAQRIVGNNGISILRGRGGDDLLIGAGGDDFLEGGTGADVMDGGAGSDTYYVDNALDVVIEPVAPGDDRIAASVSYTLGADADIEVLEAVSLADTTAMNLTGNGFGQAVIGNNGANTLDGKSGADVLVGAGGFDTFAFTSALGSGNVDRIGDFQYEQDTIVLDHNVFTGLTPGALPVGAFVIGTQAQDADDRILYISGQLFFDADGNGAGAAVLFATLDGHPAVGATDFIVI